MTGILTTLPCEAEIISKIIATSIAIDRRYEMIPPATGIMVTIREMMLIMMQTMKKAKPWLAWNLQKLEFLSAR